MGDDVESGALFPGEFELGHRRQMRSTQRRVVRGVSQQGHASRCHDAGAQAQIHLLENEHLPYLRRGKVTLMKTPPKPP